MEIALLPDPRLKLRLALAVPLIVIGLVSLSGWHKLGNLVWTAGLLGTWRQARIVDKQFQRRTVVLFVPLRWKRWSLARFTDIEVVHSPGLFIGWALLITGAGWIIWRLLDWIFPFAFGAIELRMRLAKGGRVMVWQGNSEANFHANLALLQSHTSLPVERMGR